MRKIMLTFAVLFTLGTAMTTFTSCRDTKSTGDKIEDAADDVGDAVGDAVD